MKTKLDLLLDAVVARKRELTFDLEGYTPAQRQAVEDAATSRGLSVSGDARWLLVRDLRGRA